MSETSEMLTRWIQKRLEGMSKTAIEDEEKLLSGIAILTNSPYWAAMEHYAEHMGKQAEAMLLQAAPRDEGTIGALQASVKIWRHMLGLKKMAARQSILCRDRLAAIGKEDADGH